MALGTLRVDRRSGKHARWASWPGCSQMSLVPTTMGDARRPLRVRPPTRHPWRGVRAHRATASQSQGTSMSRGLEKGPARRPLPHCAAGETRCHPDGPTVMDEGRGCQAMIETTPGDAASTGTLSRAATHDRPGTDIIAPHCRVQGVPGVVGDAWRSPRHRNHHSWRGPATRVGPGTPERPRAALSRGLAVRPVRSH